MSEFKRTSLFISYTTTDELIAKEVKRVLNNAFKGAVAFFFSAHNIRPGDPWKERIKKNLQESDAIVSIITANSLSRPWLYIEWSAFWLADKPTFILASDDVKLSDIVSPMVDIQIASIFDSDSVTQFFQSVAELSNYEEIPYGYVPEFLEAVEKARSQQIKEAREKTYRKYGDDLLELPPDDIEKKKVAEFFLDHADYAVFNRVIHEIRDDTVKLAIALRLLNAGKLDLCCAVGQQMRAQERKVDLVVTMIDYGYEDSQAVLDLIDSMKASNLALQDVAKHLIEHGRQDAKLFIDTIDRIDSYAELRKVAVFFVQKRKIDEPRYEETVTRLSVGNRAELRNLGCGLIEHGYIPSQQLDRILETLYQYSQKEFAKLLARAHQANSSWTEQYREQHPIIDAEAERSYLMLTGSPKSASD